MDPKADQSDILAANEKLRADNATATATIAKLTADLSAANTSVAKLANLEAELATERGNVTKLTKERDDLKAKVDTFDTRVASELAKHGIRATGIEAPKKDESKDADGEALMAQFNALTDPSKRAEFLSMNGAKLRELIKHSR
jgi:cell division protein FtsB